MAAFNTRTQAREFIAGLVERGPKPPPEERGNDDRLRAIGTERDYTCTAEAVAKWMKANKHGTLMRMTRRQANEYLEERAVIVGQKTLDRDRAVLDRLPRAGKKPLDYVESEVPPGRLAQGSRAYEHNQLETVMSRQHEPAALATALAYRCGLRAHELFTLKRHDRLTKRERDILDRNKKWDPSRLKGRDGVLYVVRGKGGMYRVIVVPRDLASRLEARRVPGGFRVQDRKIYYTQFYNISGGCKWSASFNRASQRAFGWSLGAHACRHTFAQDRLSEYRDSGLSRSEALALVSQDLGHFRKRITLLYLR